MDRKVSIVLRRGMSMAQVKSKQNPNSSSQIRKSFLEYFCEEKKHCYVPSSPVFSLLDPTLAFVNAGMNQFKDVFLGAVQPAATRVANSQKCIRIGGKHNDLLHVGQDGSHHSFFEMLGNWSFGDYFKKEACIMSWDLLTKVYRIPPERLYVTYFGGDAFLGLGPDLEVKEIWREIGIEENHILPFGVKDNFWEMGAIGPCGACTEIHYDRIPERKNAGNLVNSGNADLGELWNIVFMQYNRRANGELEKLSQHFVDTGMGFERLVAILQGKTSNYDTDLFLPLFDAIKNHSGHSGYTGKYEGDSMDCDYRILADHARMITVALSDGMIPNHQNKVRAIIRKALTICNKTFKSDFSLLNEITNYVAETLADVYPNIGRNLPKVQYLIKSEYELLQSQHANALKSWNKMKETFPNLEESDVLEAPHFIDGLKYVKENIIEKGKNVIPVEDIWILLDTHGIFPELTEKLAANLGLGLEMSKFESYDLNQKRIEKERQQEKLFKDVDDEFTSEIISVLEKNKLEPSKDYFKHEYRIGNSGKYIFLKQPTTVEAIICNKELRDSICSEDVEGCKVGLVLDRTQLCSTESNRESDSGTLLIENEIVFDIEKVVKRKGFIAHFGTFKKFPKNATLAVNNIGVIEINEERRLKLMKNHSALNLLKAAVRENVRVTGEKYSMVTPTKLRFGFMVYKDKVHVDVLMQMENFVNNIIKHDVNIIKKPLTLSKFFELEDVAFIPGVSLLEPEIPVFEVSSGFTLIREHCAGTHVLRTSELEDFVITKFGKASYCVKNIEAVVGEEAVAIRQRDEENKKKLHLLSEKMKNLRDPEISQVNDLTSELKKFKDDLFHSEKISYIFKHKTLQAIENMLKNLNSLRKQSLKANVIKEIGKLVESPDRKFVVHCLYSECKNDLALETAMKVCQDKPALIFVKCGDKISAESCVPEELITKKFTAQNWIAAAMSEFSFVGGCRKRQNAKNNYFIVETNISDEELKKVIKNGNEFAEKYI